MKNYSDVFFKDRLKKENFLKSKQKNTWYKTTEEAYFFINLQKSSYGGKFFINISILYTKLEILTNLENKTYQCGSIQSRAENFIEDYLNPLRQLMLGGIPNETEEEKLNEVLKYLLDFFKKNQNIEDFKDNYHEYKTLDNAGINLKLREYCEN